MTVKQTLGTFDDKRSQRQIAVFQAYELLGARDRNRVNLGRWNDHHRERWELENIGEVRCIATAAREAG